MIMHKAKVIAAVDEDFGIGRDGEIPWHVSGDLQFFKMMTYNSAVVCGRKTYENIKGIPGRRFFVLTRDESKSGSDHGTDEHGVHESVTFAHSFESLYNKLISTTDIWIVGGASVYEHYVGKCRDVYLSRIPGTYDCDTFFPQQQLENCYEPIAELPMENFKVTRYTKNGRA